MISLVLMGPFRLAKERLAGRRVRAMYLRVTVEARAAEDLVGVL